MWRWRKKTAITEPEPTSWRPPDGFAMWLYHPPPLGIWIEAARAEWPVRHVWETRIEAPEWNVAGLYWRPWHGETIEQAILDVEPWDQARVGM